MNASLLCLLISNFLRDPLPLLVKLLLSEPVERAPEKTVTIGYRTRRFSLWFSQIFSGFPSGIQNIASRVCLDSSGLIQSDSDVVVVVVGVVVVAGSGGGGGRCG